MYKFPKLPKNKWYIDSSFGTFLLYGKATALADDLRNIVMCRTQGIEVDSVKVVNFFLSFNSILEKDVPCKCCCAIWGEQDYDVVNSAVCNWLEQTV